MSAFNAMRTFGRGLLYWKLAILKVSGKALIAAVNSLVATLNGVQWEMFTTTQKFVAMATAGAAMWMVVDAFLDQSMGILTKEEKELIASDTSSALVD